MKLLFSLLWRVKICFCWAFFFKSTLQSCCCGSKHSQYWDCSGVSLKDIMTVLQDWMGDMGDWTHSIGETSVSRCGAPSKEIRQPDPNTALKVMDPEWVKCYSPYCLLFNPVLLGCCEIHLSFHIWSYLKYLFWICFTSYSLTPLLIFFLLFN